MTFKRAVRKKVFMKVALTGPSGSGKTYSALLLAAGMGKEIALIDTENRSASLYADCSGMPEFDVLNIEPPFTLDKYKKAIDDAEKAGYDVLIIDSLSHAWAGEGGLLEQKEALDRTGRGNGYTNWATISKQQEAFKGFILQSQMHVICTIRSKQDYALVENDKGKQVPQKIGMAPIQRDGIEYEFTTVFDLSMSHDAMTSKDRTGLFDGKIFKIKKSTGEEIMKWLEAGKEELKPELNDMHVAALKAACKSAVISFEECVKVMKDRFGVDRVGLMTKKQFDELITFIPTIKAQPTVGVAQKLESGGGGGATISAPTIGAAGDPASFKNYQQSGVYPEGAQAK